MTAAKSRKAFMGNRTPMTRYVSEAVPFVRIGNRRGLTAQQLAEHPLLAEFYARFKHCFEAAPIHLDAVLFIEPEECL